MEVAQQDYVNLIKRKPVLALKVLVGTKAVDYATLEERMKARRKDKSRSPIEKMDNQRDKESLELRASHHGQKVKDIIGKYGGLVSSFKPIHAKYIASYFKAKTCLDPTMGWGGRLLGVTSNGTNYIGCDTNVGLQTGYNKLTSLVKQYTSVKVTLLWQPAEQVDFSGFTYDLVFTSPPYDDLEIYPNMPSYKNWTQEFLIPVFSRAFTHLQKGGWMALSLPDNIYQDMKFLLGEEQHRIYCPIQARNPKNKNYDIVYCWCR
jgi:hypothetical protein